jgi:crotonobetainyl-CoA:carnitine CoA-transferase CaiB-like acyl-CoA transferase
MNRLLEGITILELGQVIAGTFGDTILADLGATVIKIEPLTGDTNRNPGIAPLGDESCIHLLMNRNKQSVALNLRDERGREAFLQLVETADAVIDNFRPGVLARLGIDHDAMTERNPSIVTATVTGFGETGPARNRPAFDLVVQAYSGHLDYTGEPDGPPTRVGIPLADMAGGMYAVLTVLAGLIGRGHGGAGVHADISMLDSLVSLLGYDALDHLNTGRKVSRQGTAHTHMVPYQSFQTEDGYIVIAVREDKFWQRLCDAVGRADLQTDPRTATNSARVANRAFVLEVLEKAFLTRTSEAWLRDLEARDIPAGPVNDFAAVFADPQVQARGVVQTYQHPSLGPIRYPASPAKVAGWTFPTEPAPPLGGDTVQVLTERTRLGADEIAELAAAGVFGVAGAAPAPPTAKEPTL